MYRNKARFVAPLVIIPGPKEPKNITPYIQGVLDDFRDYRPGGIVHGAVLRVARSPHTHMLTTMHMQAPNS
jgi:hypothetical protein